LHAKKKIFTDENLSPVPHKKQLKKTTSLSPKDDIEAELFRHFDVAEMLERKEITVIEDSSDMKCDMCDGLWAGMII